MTSLLGAELYTGYELNAWHVLMAPAGWFKAIFACLKSDVAQILKLPDIALVLQTDGLDAEGNTPQAYADKTKAALARWNAWLTSTGLAVNT